jgi:hypothetical protein
VVLVIGVAVTVAPLVVESPVPGDQVKLEPLDAVRTTLVPWQTPGAEGETVMVDPEYTFTTDVATF